MTTKMIPKRFRINKGCAYSVVHVPTLRNGRELARVFFEQRLVKMARSAMGKRIGKRDKRYAFWHEVTHAILHDMNHPLYCNEKFVVRFSQRLNEVMGSMK